jgi:hypothetical protein
LAPTSRLGPPPLRLAPAVPGPDVLLRDALRRTRRRHRSTRGPRSGPRRAR